MKFAIVAILLFPFASALEPEIFLPHESPNNEQPNGNNQKIYITNVFEELEAEVFNQNGEINGESLEETTNEVFEETFQAQWDITPPAYSVKKNGMPKAGKMLKAIALTKEFKNTIVMAHNRARSVASPPASNMRKMTWDNSLEKLATKYTRKCIYEHNPSADHRRFSFVGENLFISSGYPYRAELLGHAVKMWDAEKTVYDYNTTACEAGKVCGHYTQVVWAESFKVGCGVTRCGNIDVRGNIWKNAILFGCNYGPGGNYVGEKPYKTGTLCENCDGSDKCKKKLCTNVIRDRPVFNPQTAKWSPWSGWSECSVSCGMGNKRRSRSCNTFVPTDCKGFASEVMFCMNKPCQNNPTSFKYEFVLRKGDNFLQQSLADILMNRQNLN